MKRTNIYLDEEQARLLRHLAAEEDRSFTDIVREALNEYLARQGIQAASRVVGPRRSVPEEEWRSRFDTALRRIRAGVQAGASTAEIESEIAAAGEEVRQERRARRQATGA